MKLRWECALILAAGLMVPAWGTTPPKKPRTILLSAGKQVPYSKAGDPAGAGPDETALRTRALMVDGRVSEWTTGDAHDVTDRSFVVRRALRINDQLPGEKQQSAHWVWQRGPWLLVDRINGHVAVLKLPDYDPGVSQIAWFRDYAAYCGLTASSKSLYAVVAQVAIRKPLLTKKLSEYDAADHSWPVCGPSDWQREPLRITFHPTGKDAVSFDVVGGSAVLLEDGNDQPESTAKP